MEINAVESFPISIPLPEPVSFATKEVTSRDHLIVKVSTEDGTTGIGFTWGYQEGSRIMGDVVESLLSPHVVGKDPFSSEEIWHSMYNATTQLGRKGLVIRALSAVDIAIWDLKGKLLDLPLYKLLGSYRERVPAYASGGYYKEDKSLEDLADEMQGYIDNGFEAVKMKVGGLPLEEDLERVSAVRDTIGKKRRLMIDANGAWNQEQEAIDACRAFEKYDLFWIEEPARPDNYELISRIREGVGTAISAGEQEYGRWGFRELMNYGVADIFQPTAGVIGGITEWLKVSHMAAVHDISISPTAQWNLHAHLAATSPNCIYVEYFHKERNVKIWDGIIKNPVEPEGGVIKPPQGPGLGIKFDEARLEEYRV